MRVLIQRVLKASVQVDLSIVGSIEKGLLVFVGVGENDTAEDRAYLIQKILQLRIFSDSDGKMNLSVQDVKGDLLVVSQFTLYADTKKGNRPSFIKGASPALANEQYELFLQEFKQRSGLFLANGVFGADMKVSLVNDGPVTIWMDSQHR